MLIFWSIGSSFDLVEQYSDVNLYTTVFCSSFKDNKKNIAFVKV